MDSNQMFLNGFIDNILLLLSLFQILKSCIVCLQGITREFMAFSLFC